MNDCPEWSSFEPLPPCKVSMRLHVDDEQLTNRPYAVVLCHVSKERVTIRQLREQRLAQVLDWVPGHLSTETEMLPLLQLQIAKGGYVIASFVYLAEALKFLRPQGWGR